MRPGKMLVVGVMTLGLAACPADDRTADTVATTDTPTTAAGTPGAPGTTQMEGIERISMDAIGDSNISGEASLAADGQSAQVMVRLTGAAGAQQGRMAGHIHQGRCDNIGPVAYPLEAVDLQQGGAGTATSTVNAQLNQIMDGQHVISYHQPGGDPGPPVVCGDIPQQGGGIGL